MIDTNRQYRLKARPAGPFRDSDFELVRTPVPVPGDGELLVKGTHLSIDPAMRGWMNAGHVTPVDVGAVMRAITIGQVVHSRHPGFAEGDFVHGTFGVQEFALSDGAGVYKVHPEEGRSLATFLGVLGMTAYFGLPRGHREDVALARRRSADERRGHGARRHRDVPGRTQTPVHLPEHRQARPRTRAPGVSLPPAPWRT